MKEPASWVSRWFGGGGTATGIQVNEETALRANGVFACVRVLSEGVASLPLKLYRQLPNGGKEPAASHPLYHLLQDEPNEEATAFDRRESLRGVGWDLEEHAGSFLRHFTGHAK